MSSVTPKSVFFSVIYLCIVIGFLFLFNLALTYFLNDLVFNMLDWFNGRVWWFKILLLCFGGFTIFILIWGLFGAIASIITSFSLSFFQLNPFVLIVSMLLSYASSVYGIIGLWKAAPHIDLWVILELLLMSALIFRINTLIVTPHKEKSSLYES